MTRHRGPDDLGPSSHQASGHEPLLPTPRTQHPIDLLTDRSGIPAQCPHFPETAVQVNGPSMVLGAQAEHPSGRTRAVAFGGALAWERSRPWLTRDISWFHVKHGRFELKR